MAMNVATEEKTSEPRELLKLHVRIQIDDNKS